MLIPWRAPDQIRNVAPPHRESADDERRAQHALKGARSHVREAGTHVVLAMSPPKAAGHDAVLARAHGAQMQDAQLRIVPASRDPAEHPAAVAVDPIPHDLAHEATQLPEALDPVELGHADGGLVTAGLTDEAAIPRAVVRLSAACSEARLGLHALHQQLEVPGRQVKIEVELAEVVELRQVDGFEPSVKG